MIIWIMAFDIWKHKPISSHFLYDIKNIATQQKKEDTKPKYLWDFMLKSIFIVIYEFI